MHCVHQAIWLRHCAAVRLVSMIGDEDFGEHRFSLKNGTRPAPLLAGPDYVVVHGVELATGTETLAVADGPAHRVVTGR
jgi:hypothetical protein